MNSLILQNASIEFIIFINIINTSNSNQKFLCLCLFAVSGKSDLIFCGLWVQYPRSFRIEYSNTIFETCITFLVPRPKQLPVEMFSLFEVFNYKVWVAFIFCFIITVIVLVLYKPRRLIEIIMELISLLTTGNSISIQGFIGSNCILMTWSIFALFFSLFYSSQITTYLAIPMFTPRIDTAEQLAASNLTWGTFRPSGFQFFNPSHKAEMIIQNRYRFHNFNESKKILDEIKRGQYAVLMTRYGRKWASVLRGLDEMPYDNLRIMKNCFYRPYMAQAFPLNSPLKHGFNFYLDQLYDLGIYNVIKLQVRTKYLPVDADNIFHELDKNNNEPVVLKIQHLMGAFVFLGVGLVIGCIIFAWELFMLFKF